MRVTEVSITIDSTSQTTSAPSIIEVNQFLDFDFDFDFDFVDGSSAGSSSALRFLSFLSFFSFFSFLLLFALGSVS